MNLTDWLGDHGWALWLSLALLLAVAEVVSLDLVLIMLAVGALAAAGTAAIAPDLWWLQILVGAGVSAGMLIFLRPSVLAKVRATPGLPLVDRQDGRQQRDGHRPRSTAAAARSRSTGRPGRPGPTPPT